MLYDAERRSDEHFEETRKVGKPRLGHSGQSSRNWFQMQPGIDKEITSKSMNSLGVKIKYFHRTKIERA